MENSKVWIIGLITMVIGAWALFPLGCSDDSSDDPEETDAPDDSDPIVTDCAEGQKQCNKAGNVEECNAERVWIQIEVCPKFCESGVCVDELTLKGVCRNQPLSPSPGTISPPVFSHSIGTRTNSFGSPLATDLDGDGVKELIASEFGGVTAYSQQGDQLWRRTTNGRIFAGAVLAQLDGTGAPEIVAGEHEWGQIWAWDKDGQLLTGWPFQVDGPDEKHKKEIRSCSAADLDNDGKDEIISMSRVTDWVDTPTMYAIDGDGTVMPGWPQYREKDDLACNWCGCFNQNAAVADLDNDGVLDLVFNQDMMYQAIFDATGTLRPVSTEFTRCEIEPLNHWGQVKSYPDFNAEFDRGCDTPDDYYEFTYSPPNLMDLDHEGIVEVLSVPNTHHVGSEEDRLITTGSGLAVYNPDRTHKTGFAPYKQVTTSLYPPGKETGLAEYTPTAVAANFIGDDTLEILATHLDGSARLYDIDGVERWSATWSTVDRSIVTEPLVADLDGDNVPEAILVVTYPAGTSTLMVLDGATGTTRASLDLSYQVLAAPLLTDLDDDGELELIIAAHTGGASLRIYDWPGTTTDCVLWSQGRGNAQHTGSYLPLK